MAVNYIAVPVGLTEDLLNLSRESTCAGSPFWLPGSPHSRIGRGGPTSRPAGRVLSGLIGLGSGRTSVRRVIPGPIQTHGDAFGLAEVDEPTTGMIFGPVRVPSSGVSRTTPETTCRLRVDGREPTYDPKMSKRKARLEITVDPRLRAYAEHLVDIGKAPTISDVFSDALSEKERRDREALDRLKETAAGADEAKVARMLAHVEAQAAALRQQ
jgi:hypothetical protein